MSSTYEKTLYTFIVFCLETQSTSVSVKALICRQRPFPLLQYMLYGILLPFLILFSALQMIKFAFYVAVAALGTKIHRHLALEQNLFHAEEKRTLGWCKSGCIFFHSPFSLCDACVCYISTGPNKRPQRFLARALGEEEIRKCLIRFFMCSALIDARRECIKRTFQSLHWPNFFYIRSARYAGQKRVKTD
jgi:hypothetical protein